MELTAANSRRYFLSNTLYLLPCRMKRAGDSICMRSRMQNSRTMYTIYTMAVYTVMWLHMCSSSWMLEFITRLWRVSPVYTAIVTARAQTDAP